MRTTMTLLALGTLLWTEVGSARAGIVLSDTFPYSNGALVQVSNQKWKTHSGIGAQIEVASGAIQLSQAESEDVNALLEGQPYGASGPTPVLFAGLKVRFTSLPSGSGGYFAHFKDGSTGFRARVWATTNNAAQGSFRLGISAGNAPSAVSSLDLQLNADYTLVIRLNLSDATSRLWINPASESDPSVASTDAQTPIAVAAFAFRQSSGIGILSVDELLVATSFAEALGKGPTGNGAPVILRQPQNLSVLEGAGAIFSVEAAAAEPLLYQWQFNEMPISGATNASLALTNVSSSQSGDYLVVIRTLSGVTVTSQTAVLTVNPAEPIPLSKIAELRTLIDPVSYQPTNTTGLFSAEGIVTTHVNLTGPSANALFYIQDETAGIAVFWSGATNQFIPRAGDRVRVTAPLTHFNGLLEFGPNVNNPQHQVMLLSANHALPAPFPLEFSLQNDPALIDPVEGRLVVVSNVFLDLGQANFVSGSNLLMTNESGETFVLRIDSRLSDIIGQPKPATAVTIIGVLGQFDTLPPRTEGYQLTPTRFADIIGGTIAPKILFTNVLQLARPGDTPTNSFVELALLPGDQVTIQAHVADAMGREVRIAAPTEGLPASARWNLGATSGANLTPLFTFQASDADAGKLYLVRLIADNSAATNIALWSIYIPTAIEQMIVVGEFLANASTDPGAPHFNPLARAEIPPAPNSDNEYVELVNLSDSHFDLLG